MHILCIGISHRTAKVALREQLAFNDEAARAALARLGCGRAGDSEFESSVPDGINEMAILSTCNRVELYAVATRPAFKELEAFLAEAREITADEFGPHLFELEQEQAVDHLLRVAAGLDSMVLGEPQILGQVTHALELGRAQGAVGPVLSRLFQAAIHAGKRVRTETAIAHNPASISSAAVHLAAELIPHLDRAQVSVLGAGEMAELVVEALRKRGVSRFTVVNRTLKRARELADRWDGEASTFENLAEILADSDIVIASTGAPHALVHPQIMTPIMEKRRERTVVMIDIAVPRDIDVQDGEIPGVRVYDIDSLQEYLSRSLTQRAMQMPEAEAILAEEGATFLKYLASLDLVPVVKAMRAQAETIRLTEMEKTLRRLPKLAPAERQYVETLVDALTEALVNKLLHAPITRLRSEAGSPHSAQFTYVTRSLFNLLPADQSRQDCPFAKERNSYSISGKPPEPLNS